MKRLKLLKNDISNQLAGIFNISFFTGTFPTILKIAKVDPAYEKDSKSNFSNYQLILLLPNIEYIQYLILSNIREINVFIFN